MTDKKHEGVEKEMNMPDTEAPEGGTQTIGAGYRKEMTKSKPEQQTADAEKSEGKTQTAGKDSREGTADHDTGQRTTDTEGSENAAQTNGTGEGKCGSKPEREKKTSAFDIFVGIAQILASIAAVVAAVVAFSTLNEMQIERNNAYRPEIVVTPGMFEGGLVKDGETEINGYKFMYLDYYTSNPKYLYDENPNNIESSEGKLYIDKQYLVLKNIGIGTAKDIQVTFASDWIEKAIRQLNSNLLGYKYRIESREYKSYRDEVFAEKKEQYEIEGVLLCTVDDEDYHITSIEERNKNIQYIACDDSIKVMLPEYIYNVFALYFFQNYKENSIRHEITGLFTAEFQMPDLEITIEYYDMQGKKMDDKKLAIPWTAYYYCRRPESGNIDFQPEYLRSCFYEDYIDERTFPVFDLL